MLENIKTSVIKKRIYQSIFFMLSMIIIFFNMNPVTSQASIIDHNSESYKAVYAEITKSPKEEEGNGNEKNEEEEVSWIEEAIAEIFSIIARLFDWIIQTFDCSIDSVVKGRIGRGSDAKNIFNFELVSGNIYGTIGAQIYVALRSIVQAFFLVMLFAELAKQGFRSPTAQSYAEFKDFMLTLCVNFILLFAMPQLLDVVLFLRDYIVKAVSIEFLGAGTSGVYEICKQSFETTPSFNNVFMWTASGLCALWFMLIYFSIAGTTMIMFFMFPVVCVLSLKNKELMSNWVKMMANNIVTPFVDSILIAIPVVISQSDYIEDGGTRLLLEVSFMLITMSIRGLVRQLIGLGQSAVGEGIGMGAIGRLAMLGKMGAKTGKGMFKNLSDAHKSAKNDEENAKKEDELAKLEGETGISDPNKGSYVSDVGKSAEGISGYGSSDVISSTNRESDSPIDDKIKENEEKEGIANADGAIENEVSEVSGTGTEDVISEPEGTQEDNNAIADENGESGFVSANDVVQDNEVQEGEQEISAPDGDVDTDVPIAAASETNNKNDDSINSTSESLGEEPTISPYSNRVSNLEHMDALNKDMNALKKNKNALRAKNAEIKNDKINKMADFEAQKRALQNANLQMDKEKLSDNNPELKKAIEQQQAENRIKMQEIDDQAKAYSMSADNAISANEQQIQDIDSELTEKQTELNDAKTREKVMSGGKPVGSGAEYNMEAQRNEILSRYATTENFENPEYANALSHTQKAELYRKRAAETKAKARKEAVQSVAKTSGAIYGGMVSAYGGMDGVVLGAMAGEKIGESAYNATGAVAHKGGVVATSTIAGVQNIGNDIRRTGWTGKIQQSIEERSQPNENDGFVKGTVKKIGMATANAVHTEVVHEHVPIMESARAGFVGVADTRMAVIGGAKPLNVLNPINTISSSRRQVIHDNANQARLDNGINQMDFSGRRVQPVQTVSNVEANVSHRVASGVSQERINVMNSVIRDGIVKNIVTQRVSTPVQSSNDVSHSGEKFNISTAMNLFNEKGRFTEQEAQNIAKNYTSNKKDVEIFTSLISTNFSHCAPKEAAEKIQHSLETNYSERMQDTEFRNSAYKLLEDVAKIDEPLDM